MADWLEKAAPYITPATTLIGTGLGAFGGPAGMAVGASLGASAGGLITGAIGLGQDAPEFPGPSEEEKALLARQMDLANRLSSIEGLTPQEVSNLTNMTLEQDLRAQQIINAYASVQKMSPLEKQIIQDRAETMRVAGQMDAREELMRINAGAAAARVGQALSAGQSAYGMASTVQQKEASQRMQVLNFKRAQLEAFGQAVQAAGYQAIAAGQLWDKFNEADAWGWGGSEAGTGEAYTTSTEGEVMTGSLSDELELAAYQKRAEAFQTTSSPVETMMNANVEFITATGQSPFLLTLEGMDNMNRFTLESAGYNWGAF